MAMKRGTIGFAVRLDSQVCERAYRNAAAKLSIDDKDLLDDVNGRLDLIEKLFPDPVLRDGRFSEALADAHKAFHDNKRLMKAVLYSIAMRRAKL